MEKKDYKEHCPYLEQRTTITLPKCSEARLVNKGDIFGYFCSLNDDRCRGAKRNLWGLCNDSLKLKIIKRCRIRIITDIAGYL